ncbi:hypothetical protein LCGC14_1542000 [marine sediment metagenome]|uniref:Uncharacterized protein n=1 Tax=marine sediment metagenome TaxID=412755 RepID=A0A0F9LTK9_9ZZZZ
MRWYPINLLIQPCNCTADISQESALMERNRHGVVDRAKQIRHYRAEDEAHFWHWADDEVVDAPLGPGGVWVDYRDPDLVSSYRRPRPGPI